MTIQFEVTWLIGMVIVIIGAFWALAERLLLQSQQHIDKQFEGITETLKSQDDASRRIERDLMELKVELPREYVRREDNTRVIGGLQVSIDNLSLKIDRAMLMRTRNEP